VLQPLTDVDLSTIKYYHFAMGVAAWATLAAPATPA
jgi:hypothetical protein